MLPKLSIGALFQKLSLRLMEAAKPNCFYSFDNQGHKGIGASHCIVHYHYSIIAHDHIYNTNRTQQKNLCENSH